MITLFIIALAHANPTPLHNSDVDRSCRNHRFPRLAGSWIIGCDTRQLISVAQHVESDHRIRIQRTLHLGVGDEQIVVPGQGVQDLRTDARPHGPSIPHHSQQPVFNGEWIAWVTPDRMVQWKNTSAESWNTIVQSTRRGTSPAVTRTGIAWVVDGEAKDADLWWQAFENNQSVPLDAGPGDQHLPVASGPWLAWVSNGNIVIWNTETDHRRTIETDTGFHASPTIWQDTVCWEIRDPETGIDIHCSDGLKLHRVGHQTHPSRSQHHLMFREDSGLWLYSIETER